MRSTTQRNTPRPLPWECGKGRRSQQYARRRGDHNVVLNRNHGRLAGRGASARPPRRPRTASKSATKRSRWVMSLTFAAVTCATSGTPRASVTMWCLDPAFRRSVGFHHRPALVEPSPSAQLGEGSSHASDARLRPVNASRRVASTCCLSRIPFHAVTFATATAAQHKQDAGERRARRRGFGRNGSRRAHSASSKRGCAMRDRTKSTAQVQEISQRF